MSNVNIDDLVQKCLIGEKRSGFCTFRGHTMPNTFEQSIKLIEDFEVRESDIWVVTFPKSGKTSDLN